MRITFIAPPFAGHFNPALGLARAARDAGHDIDFITGPRKWDAVEKAGMRVVRLNSVGLDTMESIANTDKPVEHNPVRLLRQFREHLAIMKAITGELHELWKNDRPPLVVADSVAVIAGFVCDRLGIPWITSCVSPASIDLWRGTPTYLGGWQPMPGLMGQIRDAAGRAAIHGFKRLVAATFSSHLKSMGFRGLYREDGSESIYSPYALLGFGIRELEFERDWPPAFEMIGPTPAAPETPRTGILPEGRPRILVSHGTHVFWAKKALVEEVLALSKRMPQVHFVISMGNPELAGEPGVRASDRVTVEQFVSYSASHLSQYDAMIHHGGTGVVYAALQAGLPAIAVPKDYDQFDYAARVDHHKLGVRLKKLEGARAAEALERVLDRRQWPNVAKFQEYMRAYEPEKRFLETLNRVIQSS